MFTVHRSRFIYASLIGLVLVLGLSAWNKPDWGFFAHKLINKKAVFTLPPEVLVFYKKNIGYLEEHAVDPDLRRYAVLGEAACHYIDMDEYGDIKKIPKYRADAELMFNPVRAISASGDTLTVFGPGLLEADSILKSGYVYSYSYTFRKELYSFEGHALRSLTYIDSSEYTLPKMDVYRDKVLALLKEKGVKLPKKANYEAEDYLDGHGQLPYNLSRQYRTLVKAFERKDAKFILKASADMGHYIGDAHVPLHTTSNYNGQKTGQLGIHGFWESRIPELFANDDYDFFVGKATYYPDIEAAFWQMVLDSHAAVDSVLSFERNLRQTFPSDRQTCADIRGRSLVEQACPEFAGAYSDSMDGMVERRMRAAILALGSVWYSAWVDAGQPDLNELSGYTPSAQDIEDEKKVQDLFQAGKIIGRDEAH